LSVFSKKILMKKETKDSWSYTNLYEIKDFLKRKNNLEKQVSGFSDFIKKMHPDMDAKIFSEFIDFSEGFNEAYAILSSLPLLKEEINQQDQQVKMLKSKLKSLSIKIDDVTRPIWHWLIGKQVLQKKVLNNKNAHRLFNSVAKLSYQLELMRKRAQFTLSEKEESIISKKDLFGQHVLTDLRTLIETEQTYFFKPVKNKPVQEIKTLSELNKFTHSPKTHLRKAAYQAQFASYQKNLQKYFMIYDAVVKDWFTEAKLRGYKNSLAVRNISNDISDQVIETLVKTCTDNRFIFQEYFRIKAKILGMKKLQRYDIYAPVNHALDKKIPYSEAKDTVIKILRRFAPGFAARAEMVFKDRHVDSHPDPNKVSGAFCATITPKITPFVLLNYTNKQRDLLIMAHELGHAVHSLYSNKQSISVQDAPLPLAETASTFSEMLVFDYLYNSTKDKKVKKALLMDKLADSYATIMRQNYFVKFELLAHEKLPTGIKQTDLSDIYFANLQEQFGNSIKVPKVFKDEWACIPHIVNSPLYCYAYSFGDLLSLALYQQYKQQGSSYISKIETVLEAGSSRQPEKLLIEIGCDINQKGFWQQGFKLIEDWLEELHKL